MHNLPPHYYHYLTQLCMYVHGPTINKGVLVMQSELAEVESRSSVVWLVLGLNISWFSLTTIAHLTRLAIYK